MALIAEKRFELSTQELHNWCWAAVSAGVYNYLSDGTGMTQCKVASKVLGRSCCPADSAVDQTHSLSGSLDQTLQELGWRTKLVQSALPFEEVKAQLDSGRPVCARIVWSSGLAAHSNVIYGYNDDGNGRQELFVSDPFFVDSVVDYNFFVNSYQDEGVWTNSVVLRKTQNGERPRVASVSYEQAPAHVRESSLAGLRRFFGGDDARPETSGDSSREDGRDPKAKGSAAGQDDFASDTKWARGAALQQCVYVLPGHALQKATSLHQAAQQTGWRFLSLSGKEPVASYVSSKKQSKTTTVQHGRRLALCLDAATTVADVVAKELLDEVDQTFQVRLLRIPAMYVEALWLVPKAAGQQWILPYRTMLPGVPPYKPIAANDFLAQCKAAYSKHQDKLKSMDQTDD